MNNDDVLERCKTHVESLLSTRGHAGLKTTSYPSQCLNFLNLEQLANQDIEDRTPNECTLAKVSDATLEAQVKLNILISGAGLGGLAAAIALRRRGHDVTVYERTPQLGEVGAGIQVPPNSSRLLFQWGLEPYLKNQAIEPTAIRMRRWQNGEVIGFTKLKPDSREKFSAPYLVIHRANFQSAMYQLARDLGVDIRLGEGVQSYDQNGPTVILDNGNVVSADLVVAADGIKSLARAVVLEGRDQPAQEAGFAAYRALVNTEQMRLDPDTSWLLDNPGQNLWVGDSRHVMTYTIAGGKSFNMVLSHPESSDSSTWRQETALQDMKRHFEGWDPRLSKIMNMIKITLKWPLLTGKPLKRWVSKSGTLVIIGDAAHPMVPYMSEGAAMAVEDGAALAEAISLIDTPAQIGEALRIFERVRLLRTGQMQEASLVNGKLWHFPDGDEQQKRDASMRAEVEQGEVEWSPNQFSDPTTQTWAYGYDAEREIRSAWEEFTQKPSRS